MQAERERRGWAPVWGGAPVTTVCAQPQEPSILTEARVHIARVHISLRRNRLRSCRFLCELLIQAYQTEINFLLLDFYADVSRAMFFGDGAYYV